MVRLWAILVAVIRAVVRPPLAAIAGLWSSTALPLARAAAGISLVIAAVALAHDIGPVTAGGRSEFKPMSAMQHWQKLAPANFEATRGFVTKRMASWAWGAISGLLAFPTFVVATLLAVVFGYLGRRRRRVEIFAN